MTESPYPAALRSTLATIEKRSQLYRRTVQGLVGIGFAALAASTATGWRWGLFAGLLALPWIGLFFLRDQCLLARWRHGIRQRWLEGDLAFSVLSAALHAQPKMPQATLRAMLTELTHPLGEDWAAETVPVSAALDAPTRAARLQAAWRQERWAHWRLHGLVAATCLPSLAAGLWAWLAR